jgi:hypothetical protein
MKYFSSVALTTIMMLVPSVVESFQALSHSSMNSIQKRGMTNQQSMMKYQKMNNNKNQFSYDSKSSSTTTTLQMSTGEKQANNLPMLLDPGTKGGALFLSLVLFILPIAIYEVVTLGFGIDGIEAGKWIGVGFTLFTTVLWVATYIFRVATKDMTYAKQLKDYENAVIAKRLEELDEDEIQALVEDIERDDF